MIDAGDIFAQIDEEAGMVRFLEDPQQYSSSEMASHLDAQVQRARILAEKMKVLNHEVKPLCFTLRSEAWPGLLAVSDLNRTGAPVG